MSTATHSEQRSVSPGRPAPQVPPAPLAQASAHLTYLALHRNPYADSTPASCVTRYALRRACLANLTRASICVHKVSAVAVGIGSSYPTVWSALTQVTIIQPAS